MDEDKPGDPGADASLRPIPDGGLGTSIPDWLQQPPAWKREAVQVEALAIPSPDTSVIDPRAMLEIDDLPSWLQSIAAREPGPEVAAPDTGNEIPEVKVALSPLTPAYTPDVSAPVSPKTPWWLSEAAVGGLFVAIVLTIIYVILAATGAI